MADSHNTDIAQLLGELNGGVLEQMINHALSDVAANVCQTGKKGTVILSFTLERIQESSQITLKHGLKTTTPKQRGKIVEEHETATPLHVGRGGTLTLFPNTQTSLELGAGAATGRTDGGR